MSIASELRRSQKHLERALGRPTFTWNGTAYVCTTGSAASGKNLGPGGFSLEADLVLFARAELFPADAFPVASQKLTHADKTYRIESVSVLPGRGVIRISCMDARQKL